jgi:ACS family hexuronate transporter-like MFS transporter
MISQPPAGPTAQLGKPGAETRRSHVRLTVGAMIFLVTVINFSDRGVFGAVGPMLVKNFHLTTAQFGMIGGAFGFGYVASTFLGGLTLRLCGGPTRVYVWFVSAWSVALGATALATGYASLLVYRVLFGFCEGVIFPSGQQLAGRWFPPHERGRIAAWCFTLGQPVGPLLATPIVVAITTALGWRVPFIIWMVLGVAWAIAAGRLLTDEPRQHPGVTAAELEVIGPTAATDRPASSLAIFTNPYLWVSGLCFFASAYVLYFLLTFFPLYLVQERHIPYSHVGVIGALPFLGLAVGAALSGWTLDRLWRKSRGNMYLSRTLVAAACQLIAGLIFILVLTTNASTDAILAMVFFAALFAYAANPVFFSLPMDVMPRQAGTAGALVTGIGSSAGIFAPIITGELVQATGTYASAILVVAAISIVSAVVLILFDPFGRLVRQQAAIQVPAGTAEMSA